MSLSRLSPRSSEKALSRQGRKSKRPAKQFRHIRLWDAIRRTQQELDQWQQRLNQVDSLFNRFIVPREENLTQIVTTVTEKLVHHFSNDVLDTADQSLLGLWITDNLQSLHGHPFASQERTEILLDQWRQLINQDGAIENQLSKLAGKFDSVNGIPGHLPGHLKEETNQAVDADKPAPIDEAVKTDSANHNESSAHQSDQPKVSDARNNKRRQNQSGKAQDQTSADEKISILEKSLSVERLFRQLAKALHPDLETNEERRAAKHALMAECLNARKNKDINTLLTLYCEHIGSLPDDLTDDSHEELIEALETQLRQLQNSLRQQRFGDPLQAMIVDRYSSTDSAICEKRIEEHSDSLDNEISAMKRLNCRLESHQGLLDSLDERRAVEQDRLAIDQMTGAVPGHY